MKVIGRLLNKKYYIFIILALAFFLRVVSLSTYPYGFTPDEASDGYDAYSLIQTGKDQWGHTLPLVLESFGDYKPPLYAYIATPFIATLGLTKVAIRLPNALAGTAAVYVVYLLIKELKKLNKKRTKSKDKRLALVASFLLAISPWHIFMSRGAFQASLTTLLMPLGIYLFIKGIKQPKKLIWSAIILGLNLFSYHSAKLVTPIMIVVLVYFFRKELLKLKKKELLIPLGIMGIFLGLMSYTFLQGAGERVKDISLFKGAMEAAGIERVTAVLSGMNPILARLMHNKVLFVARRFMSNYLLYFSPQFLFTHGPAEATYGMIPGRGMLYWFELPFLAWFVYSLSKFKEKKFLSIILIWLFLAPIPAALATGPGYAGNRAVIMLPAIQIILAFGAISLYDAVRQKYGKEILKKLTIGYVAIVLIFFAMFIEDWVVQSPKKTAQAMLYGHFEATQWLAENVAPDRKIIVSKKLSEPQIFVAYANKWDPLDYQEATKGWLYKENNLLWVDQLPEYSLGNYTFKNFYWETDREEVAVFVGKPEDFPGVTDPLMVFYYPDDEPSIYIVDTVTKLYAHKNK
ncbi:glycosyltransferase family 39 protein [Patescibacteria group bacterium]|nr:glycosyltransferase family 39 protein [Patescibacteria group bacterium]MBU0777352.1 glycosyltransferase family 39 protein [Patescibacteria group bacterium]MBU0845980.1 glycosyltransferase family 39 protein [Patescibacteria group bacterium]MBU0922528.1 glycosyltransferase family 39 protein [Patescibacteria group bacterium]MBU1066539.1 glycosyltransferase family 39 protein [Patescibacteria group bacterium]